MVPVSRLRTAPHSHFICCPPPLPSALLYSSQTRLYLSSHFIPPPPSKRPAARVTRDSQPTHTIPDQQRNNNLLFLPSASLIVKKTILQFCSRLYSFGIGEIKVSKTKTNIKIKLSKRAPSCFPEVQIVLQVSQRDHHHITIHHSLTPNTKTNTKHKDKQK